MKKYNFVKRLILSILFGIGVFANQASWAIAKETKKTLVLDDVLKIEGTVEKPEAYFILQRKNFDSLLNAETAPKFNAVEQIVDAVKSEIFN